MRWRTTRRGALVALALMLTGCGDDDGGAVREIAEGETSGSGTASGSATAGVAGSCTPFGDPTDSDANVVVTLDEWAVVPAPGEVGAGAVTFLARNEGEEVHELVVVRAESPGALEVADGQVQEDALAEEDFLGEVEGFPAGSTCDGTFELDAGDYVLFCNIVETEADGTLESHFEEGMVNEFRVS